MQRNDVRQAFSLSSVCEKLKFVGQEPASLAFPDEETIDSGRTRLLYFRHAIAEIYPARIQAPP